MFRAILTDLEWTLFVIFLLLAVGYGYLVGKYDRDDPPRKRFNKPLVIAIISCLWAMLIIGFLLV